MGQKNKDPPSKKSPGMFFFLRELFFDKIKKKIGPVYSFNDRILISLKFNISRVEKALRGQAAPLLKSLMSPNKTEIEPIWFYAPRVDAHA